MSRSPLFSTLVLLSLVACAGAPRPATSRSSSARWALVGARVYGHPEASVVLVDQGQIADLSASAPAGVTTVDAQGGLVLPGFIDHHTHLYSGAVALGSADLSEARSVEDVQASLRAYAAEHPGSGWLIGRGWTYDLFRPGQGPHRDLIDRAVSDRPVFLEAYDGHSAWVNTKALETAGVALEGSAAEVAAGHLLEGNMALVEDRIPAPSIEQIEAALLRGAEHCLALGIVEVHDVVRDPRVIESYLELDRAGRLPMRVQISPLLDSDVERWAKLRDSLHTDRIRFGPLKGFVDGVIESKTAYMLEDYATGGGRGQPLLSPEALDHQVARATAAGFAVRLHAIGDAAVRMALDAFEAHPAPAGTRHQVEHIEVLDPADRPRFAKLGVIASMQPYHANPFGDHPETGTWARNLGPEREAGSFAWRNLLDAKAELRFGSDWPVMSADPLLGLAVAMTRQDAEGRPAAGWHPEQALGFDESLRAYSGRDRLEVGDPADLVVLEPGPDPATPSSFFTGKVRCTSVAGAPPRCPPPPNDS